MESGGSPEGDRMGSGGVLEAVEAYGDVKGNSYGSQIKWASPSPRRGSGGGPEGVRRGSGGSP
jgi:hypothetical protein